MWAIFGQDVSCVERFVAWMMYGLENFHDLALAEKLFTEDSFVVWTFLLLVVYWKQFYWENILRPGHI